MLEKLLQTLCDELSISPIPERNKENSYLFQLSDSISAKLTDLNPGVSLSSTICTLSKTNKEDLYIYLMRTNLLGQGTGGSRIGLEQNEKVLTLSLGLPYEMNYPTFKEKFEDFINYVIYWREEVKKFEQEHP